jgi:hypothetical protein
LCLASAWASPTLGQARTLLAAPATFYIGPAGQDVPTCGSQQQPCATRGYVWFLLTSQYDLGCQFVTIVLMDGTYTEGTRGGRGTAQSGNPPGNCYFHQIKYVAQNPGAAILKPTTGYTFLAQLGASFEVDDMVLDGSVSGADLIVLNTGGTLLLKGNTFRCSPNMRDIQPGVGSFVIITGETIDKTGCPPSMAHIAGDRGNVVFYNGTPTTKILGNPTYTGAFLINDGGTMAVCGLNFTSTFNGPPFLVYNSGVIYTCAGGPFGANQHPGFLPGSMAYVSARFNEGATSMDVSPADAAALANLFQGNVGLLIVGPCLQGGTVVPSMDSIAGTTVQITAPTTCASNGAVLLAGGFVHSGGQYFGSQPFMAPPR